MKLSDHNNKTLKLALHQSIENYADYSANLLSKGNIEDSIIYPPNGGLTNEERHSLKQLSKIPHLKSALRKVLADNAAQVVFDLFNHIDGTTDPDEALGEWTGVSLVDKTDDIEENDEMHHDNFLDTYWDWRALRTNQSWKLDLYEG
ncbi:hypothetical protein [Roseivirga misakiensis]|uniref:Uncharacterized protein n=1 Tax=Roseivirga misakiensis TaxID=1563681 RepID=A0A1E5SYN7_9BACT|nr:hypothetical protein [Roseivirga misakiensis]OEK04222.1 hypothetical protein BFP71_12115 [Roseivirga misakiensis]